MVPAESHKLIHSGNRGSSPLRATKVLTTRPTRVKERVRHSLNRIGSYHKNALNLLTLFLYRGELSSSLAS